MRRGLRNRLRRARPRLTHREVRLSEKRTSQGEAYYQGSQAARNPSVRRSCRLPWSLLRRGRGRQLKRTPSSLSRGPRGPASRSCRQSSTAACRSPPILQTRASGSSKSATGSRHLKVSQVSICSTQWDRAWWMGDDPDRPRDRLRRVFADPGGSRLSHDRDQGEPFAAKSPTTPGVSGRIGAVLPYNSMFPERQVRCSWDLPALASISPGAAVPPPSY
jgi:hypothetical protein